MTADAATPADQVDWTVTVVELLPDCPSPKQAWEKIATQTRWNEWRSESKMRGKGVVTRLVPPAQEPLQARDEYIVSVGIMKIHCQVIDSQNLHSHEWVFDAKARALCGLVKARFRYTFHRNESGVIVAKAQEQIKSLTCLMPLKSDLEAEHHHTFRDLNASFR